MDVRYGAPPLVGMQCAHNEDDDDKVCAARHKVEREPVAGGHVPYASTNGTRGWGEVERVVLV